MASETGDTHEHANEDGKEVKQEAEVVDEAVTNSLTGVEAPATLRDDQIQNAVAFLNHPKVQGSTESAKTSFLEKKGLTPEEIKEAFSRASTSSTGNSAASYNAASSLPPAGNQPARPFHHNNQATIQALQPQQGMQLAQMQNRSQSLKWTQVVLGASVVVAGAYALKQMVAPLASKWYRQFYGIQEAQESEQQTQYDKTAELIASAIESQTKELKSTVDSLKDMMTRLEKERGKQPAYQASPAISVDDLRSELHAFASTLSMAGSKNQVDAELRSELSQIKQLVREKSSTPPNGPNVTPNGLLSPNVKSTQGLNTAYSGANGTSRVGPPAARAHQKQPVSSQPAPESSQPSYMEVLEMLERGETPPNVRTDINDKPPNPEQAPPSSHAQPRLKPWERTAAPKNNDFRSVGSKSSPHTVITELGDESEHADTKPPSGAWRPPAIPQASIRHSNPSSNAAESEGDATSVRSADRISENGD